MKFNIWIYISVFCFGFSNSQNESNKNILIVDYTHTIHFEGLPTRTTIDAVLVSSNIYSIYEMDFTGNSNFIDEEDNENGSVLNIRPTKNPKIFKDLSTKNNYSIERIFMTPFLVKDNMSIFSWTLKDEYKSILGYNCQKSVLNYRGRDYVAYFTIEIPYNNGPWKFSGLPGLILEIKSIDGVFKIEANKIEIKNISSKITNPFIKKIDNAISWDEFTSKYKKKYFELQSFTTPDGGSRSIPKRKIETLIED